MEYDVAALVRKALELALKELGSNLQEFATNDLVWARKYVVPIVIRELCHLPENEDQISELVHKQWGELKGELITQEFFSELATTR